MRIRSTVLLLVATPMIVQAEDDTRTITGRVVDSGGTPIANVKVATFWNANGITKEELRERLQSPGIPIQWQHEGDMQPRGKQLQSHLETTDAEGRFEISCDIDDYKVMALDAERQRGGIGLLDADDPQAPMEIVLQPLVKVHGNLLVNGQKDPPNWTGAIISLPVHEHFPLGRNRLAFCGSDRARFAFRLPPGRYSLWLYNDGGVGEETSHAGKELEFIIKPDIAERELNLGEVWLDVTPTFAELAARSEASGKWGKYTKRYGQPAPEWHVDDAKGVAKSVQPRDYRGKWLVAYFWGPYCRPCLKSGLPSLIDFHERYAGQRDRFEIVAICIDKDGGMQSIGDLDRLLRPVVENAWGGKSLEFPVLLDNSFKTCERYGLDSVGHLILIDPDGNLHPGDLATLAEKLETSR